MTDELRDFFKVKKVIESCKTREQLTLARAFARLYNDKYHQLYWEIRCILDTKLYAIEFIERQEYERGMS